MPIKGSASVTLEEFERIFRAKEAPSEMPEFRVAAGEVYLPKLLVDCGLAKSNSDAMRTIAQGGVSLDDVRVASGTKNVVLEAGLAVVIKVGKRHFARVIAG